MLLFAQIETSLPDGALQGLSWDQLPEGAALELTAPGMPTLKVPLRATSSSQATMCATPASACQLTALLAGWSGPAARCAMSHECLLAMHTVLLRCTLTCMHTT